VPRKNGGGVWSLLILVALMPRKNPGAHGIESEMSLRADLDILKIKISFPCQELDPVPLSLQRC